MAKDTLNQKSPALMPTGIDDNTPVAASPSGLYFSNGIILGDEQQLQRCNGKSLAHKFPNPVLAIHGDLRTRILVETTEAIYTFDSLEDALPPIP